MRGPLAEGGIPPAPPLATAQELVIGLADLHAMVRASPVLSPLARSGQVHVVLLRLQLQLVCRPAHG